MPVYLIKSSARLIASTFCENTTLENNKLGKKNLSIKNKYFKGLGY
jgi:hypothetical protein